MFNKDKYKKRLIDEKIDEYLKIFGAIVIEGPKWVGKTWTSEMHSKSSVSLAEESFKNLAKANPKYIFTDKRPELIDEWQIVPEIWDTVRNECDNSDNKGNFILTGSTSLSKDDKENKIFHSGAGRFARMKMYPMSLYESGESSGSVSIKDLYDNKKIKEGIITDSKDLRDIALYCIRGGFPENIGITDEKSLKLIPENYIKALCEDESNGNERYSPNKLKQILISLARNESTLASKQTILSDITDSYDMDDKKTMLESRITLDKYLDFLKRLFVIDDIEAYSTNYRSVSRVGKNSKKHLVDPSLVCSLLKLNKEKLLLDHKTFGYVFESLALRDLKVYMNYLDGNIYHFRDNLHGDEVDAILEFDDGEYAACEIKLTKEGIEDGKKSLMKFYNNVKKKPKFMCIILADYNAVIKDKDTGIYIMPLTALRT